MPTFIQIDDRAAAVIAAAVLIGVAFLVAPDQSIEVVENVSDAIKGVLP
ncbi:hypothetical protein ACOZ4L_02725 [Haloplanus ruber]|uniref:Uncharacterized protein n=1 Tax=Haloplanus ruber TaxID=869892 RepID=A0ABD6D0B2_9EURY|nr:hypothetical protein [Haloplanus ruber]